MTIDDAIKSLESYRTKLGRGDVPVVTGRIVEEGFCFTAIDIFDELEIPNDCDACHSAETQYSLVIAAVEPGFLQEIEKVPKLSLVKGGEDVHRN